MSNEKGKARDIYTKFGNEESLKHQIANNKENGISEDIQ